MEVVVKLYKISPPKLEPVLELTRETINASKAGDSDELFAAEPTHTFYQINIDDDVETTLNKIYLMTEIPQPCALITDSNFNVLGHYYRYLDRHKSIRLNLREFVGSPKERYKETSVPGIQHDAKILAYFRKGNMQLVPNTKEILGGMLIPDSELCFNSTRTSKPGTYEIRVFDIRHLRLNRSDNDLMEGFVRVLWPSFDTPAPISIDNKIIEYTTCQKYIDLLNDSDITKWPIKNDLNRAIIKVTSSAKEDDTIWNLQLIFDNFKLSGMFPCIAIYDGTQRATKFRTLKSFIENDFVKYDKIRAKQFNNPFFRLKLWTNFESGFGKIDIYKNGEMTLNMSWSYSGFGGVNCLDRAARVFDILRTALLEIPHSRIFVLPRPFVIQETEQPAKWEISSFTLTIDFINRPNSSLFRLLMLSFPFHISLTARKDNPMIFEGEYLRAGLTKQYDSTDLAGIKFDLKHHISMRIIEIKNMRLFDIICRFVAQVADLTERFKGLNSPIKQQIEASIRQLEQKYPLLRREIYKDTDSYKELRIRRLQRNDSQLFSFHKYIKTSEQSKYKPYSKLCQGKAQPLVLSSLKEVKEFAQTHKHFTHHIEVNNKTNPHKKDYYVCPHKKYAYPGFKDPKLHPKGFCLPCCKKISSIENPRSVNFLKYQSCLQDKPVPAEKNTYNPNYVKLYGKPIRELQLGRLPDDLFFVLNRRKGCNISSSHQLQRNSECYLMTRLPAKPAAPAIQIRYIDNAMTLHLPRFTPDTEYQVIFTDENGDNNIILISDHQKQHLFKTEHYLVARLTKIAKNVIRANETQLEKQLAQGLTVPPTIFNVEYLFREKIHQQLIQRDRSVGFYTSVGFLPVFPDTPLKKTPTTDKLPTWAEVSSGISKLKAAGIHLEYIVMYESQHHELFSCLLDSHGQRLLIKFQPTRASVIYPVLQDSTGLHCAPQPPGEDLRTKHITAIHTRLTEYYLIVEQLSDILNNEHASNWRDKYLAAYKQYLRTSDGAEFRDQIRKCISDTPDHDTDYMLIKWITLQISKQRKPPVEWVSKLLNSITLELDKHTKQTIRQNISKKNVILSVLKQLFPTASKNVVEKVAFDLINNVLRREQILNNTIPYHSELILGDDEILEVISLAST